MQAGPSGSQAPVREPRTAPWVTVCSPYPHSYVSLWSRGLGLAWPPIWWGFVLALPIMVVPTLSHLQPLFTPLSDAG